jgi:hypothetical protein
VGSWTSAGLTGNGHVSFGGFVEVTDVASKVTAVTGRSMIVGTDPTEIQHVKYAGLVGVGCYPEDDPACGVPSVNWWVTIGFMQQDINLYAANGSNIFAASVFWALKPGVEITLSAYWV